MHRPPEGHNRGWGWVWGVCMGLVPLCSFLSQNEAENTFHRLLMHRLEMDYKYTRLFHSFFFTGPHLHQYWNPSQSEGGPAIPTAIEKDQGQDHLMWSDKLLIPSEGTSTLSTIELQVHCVFNLLSRSFSMSLSSCYTSLQHWCWSYQWVVKSKGIACKALTNFWQNIFQSIMYFNYKDILSWALLTASILKFYRSFDLQT